MTYRPKRPPRDYQKRANAKARGRPYFAWLMAQRTGKTKVAIDEFGELEEAGEVLDQTVISFGGAYKNWVEAIETDASEDLQERMLLHTWRSGDGVGVQREREKFLAACSDRRRPRTLLMNIEALSRPGTARKFLLEYLSQRKGKRLTNIDEVTGIKNKSKRTDFVNSKVYPLSDVRRIMSGLATPRSPLDLFYEFMFLDEDILGHSSWYTFRAEVAYLKTQWLAGRSVIVIDQEKGDRGFRPEAIEELYQRIEPHSFRVQFRPKIPSTYSIVEVEMTREQRQAYAEIKDFATTRLASGHHVTSKVVIDQMMKLHQVLCGHIKDDEGVVRYIPESRTQALLDLLETYAGKAVVWCSYDIDVRKVALALERTFGDPDATDFRTDGIVSRFWGGNEKTRDAETARFKKEPRCRFQVATPDAGRYGNTWDVADLAVYYSSRDNLDHRDQSEQRTMGVDKSRGVDNIDLICPGTVEMLILQALRSKINMATVINGDNWKQWVI